MAGASREHSADSEEASAAIEELTASIETIVDNVTRQTSNITTNFAEIQKLSDMTDDVNNAMIQLDDLAATSSSRAINSEETAGMVTSAMEDIRQSSS